METLSNSRLVALPVLLDDSALNFGNVYKTLKMILRGVIFNHSLKLLAIIIWIGVSYHKSNHYILSWSFVFNTPLPYECS
jgi:hypothetical protein